MTKPVRVLLVEDHALVRAGIAAILRTLPGVEVVAEATNGHEALRLIKESRPTLVLTDISMPSLNGMEVLARITKEYPEIRVLMLSMYIDEEHVRSALQCGAAGFLSKDSSPTELAMAIEAVERGDFYLSSKITSTVMKDYFHRRSGRETQIALQDRGPLMRLTPRQREILQLVVEGYSTKGIATLLNITVKTVVAHRLQLMTRLGIHDTAGLVRYAVRHGLTALD